jgi:hypothetical protein
MVLAIPAQRVRRTPLQVAFRQLKWLRMRKVQIDQALYWTFLSCAVFRPQACVY